MQFVKRKGCKSGVGVGGGLEGFAMLDACGRWNGGRDEGDAGSQSTTNHKGILGLEDVLSAAALSLPPKKANWPDLPN